MNNDQNNNIDSMNSNMNFVTSDNVSNQNEVNVSDNNLNQELYDTTNNINSVPVVKKKKNSVQINSDLMIIVILGFILLIFILLMPTIYDVIFR